MLRLHLYIYQLWTRLCAYLIPLSLLPWGLLLSASRFKIIGLAPHIMTPRHVTQAHFGPLISDVHIPCLMAEGFKLSSSEPDNKARSTVSDG
ncbi:hypothetical protein BJV82DRAFT_329772 [Fennellomyces sp. T-0311]|nr:hypothetical protein BJV82DRAFT_329772 [Fennellomyces sp. T-0311]